MLEQSGIRRKCSRDILRGVSRAFFDGIALFDPICGDAGWENENAEMSEAHVAQGAKGGAEVGAAIERAAAAVDDKIGIFGERCREFLEVGDALFSRTGAVKGCARNVRAGVESADANVNDFNRGIALGMELFGEVSGRNGLRGHPWVGVCSRGCTGICADGEVRGTQQQKDWKQASQKFHVVRIEVVWRKSKGTAS